MRSIRVWNDEENGVETEEEKEVTKSPQRQQLYEQIFDYRGNDVTNYTSTTEKKYPKEEGE